MTIIDNLEYESEIKEVYDTNSKSASICYWSGVIMTVIIFLSCLRLS